jgi:nucleoside-diphosphate-sugar epimerase
MVTATAPSRRPSRPDPVVAVVGAAGFLGAAATQTLSAAGVEVCRCTRAEPTLLEARLHPALARADAVFYLATRMNPAIAEREPGRAVAEVAAFEAFLDVLRDNRRRPVVTLAGSGGTVYDPRCKPPYGEQSPVCPSSVYGRAKFAQEEALARASDWVVPKVLRLSNVSGPGHPPPSPAPQPPGHRSASAHAATSPPLIPTATRTTAVAVLGRLSSALLGLPAWPTTSIHGIRQRSAVG